MYQDLHFYIDLKWDGFIANPKTYLKETHKMVQFVHQHHATIYYSEAQKTEFIKSITDLDKNYLTSIGNQLEMILRTATNRGKNGYVFEVCFADGNTSLNHLQDKFLESMENHSKLSVLSNVTDNPGKKSLLIIKSSTEFKGLEFTTFNRINELLQWIVSNGPKRNFNLSGKHGENGKGNWKNESKLLCDRHHAQNLLNSSIPDFNRKEKELFNFDTVFNRYIEFYFEGRNPQNQWHGFHIEPEDWNEQVPESIRKYFGK